MEAEKKRYEAANAKAIEQLEALHAKAVKEVGEANAAVFEVHMMMLEDDDYVSSIRNMIETQQVNAEFAIASVRSHSEQDHRLLRSPALLPYHPRILSGLIQRSNDLKYL